MTADAVGADGTPVVTVARWGRFCERENGARRQQGEAETGSCPPLKGPRRGGGSHDVEHGLGWDGCHDRVTRERREVGEGTDMWARAVSGSEEGKGAGGNGCG
jgi:hypothetical protein